MCQFDPIKHCDGCYRHMKIISPGLPLHECPYQADVHNDSTFQCNCCENCTHECAMDV